MVPRSDSAAALADGFHVAVHAGAAGVARTFSEGGMIRLEIRIELNLFLSSFSSLSSSWK